MLPNKSFFSKYLLFFMQIFLFLLIIVFIYKKHLLNLSTNILFNFQDPSLNMYFLEWGAKYLLGEIPNYIHSIYSLPVAYPYQNSLAFSDNLFGNLVIFLPLYAATKNNILSYNLWILISHGLNFFAIIFFLTKTQLIYYRTSSHKFILSTIGGIIFAFSLPAITLLGAHFQLIGMFFIPITVYFYEQIWLKNSITNHILFALSLSIQFYLAVHLGFFLLVLLLSLTPMYYANQRVEFNFILKKIPYSFLIVLVLVGGLLYPYLISAKLTGYRGFSDVSANIPSITNFFTTEISYNLNNWLSIDSSKHHEKAIFLGVAPFFLLCMLLIKKISLTKRQFTISFNDNTEIRYALYALIFLSLFIVQESQIFRIFFSLVPGFNAIRTPGRFILVVAFVFALLVALKFSKIRLFKLYTIAILFITIFLVETYSITINSQNYKEKLLRENKVQIYRQHIKGPSIVLPLFPMPVGEFYNDMILKMMNYSFYSPILNIYSGHFPQFNDRISKQYNNIKNEKDLEHFIKRIRKLGFFNIVLDQEVHTNSNANVEKPLEKNKQVVKIFNDNKISAWVLRNKLSIYYPSLNNSLKEKEENYFQPTTAKISRKRIVFKGRIIDDFSIVGVVQKKEKIPYPFWLSFDGEHFEKKVCYLSLDRLVDAYDDFECVLREKVQKNSEIFFKNINHEQKKESSTISVKVEK